MNILITGGAGYIGSVLCEELLGIGGAMGEIEKVTVLDNFRHGVPSLSHLMHHKNFELHRGDARNKEDLLPLLSDADIIIPLAALVGVSECERDKTAAVTTNYEAIRTLVHERSKSQRIIFPNTNSGYGTSGEAVCTEESPLKPISIYGTTKCNAEKLIMDAGYATVFRLATVFGMSPRMRWDLMVNDFVWRAVRDRCITLFEAKFRRNFIHVRDVARAFHWAALLPVSTADQIYNLGLDDANFTKEELCVRIAQKNKLYWQEIPFAEDPDKRDYFVSNVKIKQAGFTTAVSLDEGINELIKGVRQYG